MNSSQLEFSSLNIFPHPGSFYLSVSPPWLLPFFTSLRFCTVLKGIQYLLLPWINSQMKMEIAVMFGLCETSSTLLLEKNTTKWPQCACSLQVTKQLKLKLHINLRRIGPVSLPIMTVMEPLQFGLALLMLLEPNDRTSVCVELCVKVKFPKHCLVCAPDCCAC